MGYSFVMDFGIEGRVAMVAAATKGIGLACARALVDQGCRVGICGRDASTGAAAVEELGAAARYFSCDVSLEADLTDWHNWCRRELGEPDILVTNTGGPPVGAWDQVTDEDWISGVNSTLLNVVRLSRMVAPSMREQGWGRIVHITSLVAVEPSQILPISSAIRSGLSALTRLQGRDLAAFGVTVNAVLPGHTLTDRQRHLARVRAEREGCSFEDALASQARESPLGRLIEPNEIGAVVAFLCSRQASAVTGTSLLVDGGQTRSA